MHDGILGKLFGIRLSLDSLNQEETEKSRKKRFKYIEEMQKIAEEIRFLYHKLNKTSLVDVNFKTVLKEIVKNQSTKETRITLKVDSSMTGTILEK
ncbi:hypothetical protein [Autumnicola musiva]|uniref:Signal transduction histidine kinase subgroup 3 dimerisation and phosphoacceptor domain-containing protein n=1 Tax=Autumnicola musiva TaxID=3075589 RepID=A0ABU3DB37_9FLAO|nr:hypothetical protein [Zunongwangia sp. F117]MDT0678748.1 hypothetical protein [Zunongwangia sp. F117]